MPIGDRWKKKVNTSPILFPKKDGAGKRRLRINDLDLRSKGDIAPSNKPNRGTWYGVPSTGHNPN